MFDFLTEFVGSVITDYPFLGAVLSVILASVVLFMFYTIIASLFKVRG